MITRQGWSSAALCGGLACLVLAVLATAVAQTGPSGDAVRGKQLYYDHGCFGCHGFNGVGGARNLVGTGSPILAESGAFIGYLRLRADYTPIVPSTRMPSYPERALSRGDVMDIYAYVRTFALNVPNAATIPAFQIILESAKAPYKPAPQR